MKKKLNKLIVTMTALFQNVSVALKDTKGPANGHVYS